MSTSTDRHICLTWPFLLLGFLTPGLCRLDGSAFPPNRIERKFVCKVTFKHLPQSLISHIQSFGIIGQLLKIPPLCTQKSHIAGKRGIHNFVCVCGNLIFCAKFHNPRTTPGRKMTLKVDTMFHLLQCP